ncbi:MAG: kynureninase [Pseudomonadota bacterium]|nr:kynureninase [Pseudomonadota bacterium]
MSAIATETYALHQDACDPLAGFRDEFLIPRHHDGREQIYLCGNSLGLQPVSTRAAMIAELDDWRDLGVEGHFRGKHPWMPYHSFVREHLAEVAGALPSEVVAMNTLTTNLHLMLVTFYRPTAERPAILIEKHAFPSDRHAVASQIRFHGLDPAQCLIELEADQADGSISDAALERAIAQHGPRLALVLWPGVQYLTGQNFDLKAITQQVHRAGAIAGFDLAHAIGNVEVNLHDANADFAVWCSYKYLNSGPGAIAGCFVHERHAHTERPRFAGWWGHDQATRFQMRPEFNPTPGADGWQLSNPSIFAMAPLRSSLDVFHRAGMARLREKSIRMTAYLADCLQQLASARVEVRTPAAPEQRGAQLSLRVHGSRDTGKSLFEFLAEDGIVADWREPDIIRVAATPLYNRYSDCLRLVQRIEQFESA